MKCIAIDGDCNDVALQLIDQTGEIIKIDDGDENKEDEVIITAKTDKNDDSDNDDNE